MGFCGLPPIGQKQRRPMDGTVSFPRGSASTVDGCYRAHVIFGWDKIFRSLFSPYPS
jgi:hypothetical protein